MTRAYQPTEPAELTEYRGATWVRCSGCGEYKSYDQRLYENKEENLITVACDNCGTVAGVPIR